MTRQGIPAVPDTECQVLSLGNDVPAVRRLAQMGLCPGVNIRVVRVGPLGGPLALALETGQHIALRSREAAAIQCRITALPLTAVNLDDPFTYRVRETPGKGLLRKLEGLGLKPGSLLSVQGKRPYLIRLIPEGLLITLGRGEAAKLLVEPCEATPNRA